MKNIPSFEEFVNESALNQLYEGHMSNLIIIAQEAKNYEDFVKSAMKEYPQLKKEKDLDTWLKSIYDTAVNEAEALPGAIHTQLGPKQGRLVIDNISEEPEIIINAIKKIDKSSRLEFFEKTGKIVGVIAVARLKDIKRIVAGIDKTAVSEIRKKQALTKI